MKRSLIPMAAIALLVTAGAAHAVTPIPAANKWTSSLTEPTPLVGADFHITKPSNATITTTPGNVSFQIRLSGVTNGVGGPLVTQTANTFQVDLRYVSGAFHTETFTFNLVGGKTPAPAPKFTLALNSLGGTPPVPGDSIQVVAVRCIQGGAGPGAGANFCTAGLTAK
jgi:hypothetical protein